MRVVSIGRRVWDVGDANGSVEPHPNTSRVRHVRQWPHSLPSGTLSLYFRHTLLRSTPMVERSTPHLTIDPTYVPLACEKAPLHPAVESFAKGFEGMRPSDSTVETAGMIVQAALEKTAQKEIEVDDTDGSLTFELRLTGGLLIIGELSLTVGDYLDIASHVSSRIGETFQVQVEWRTEDQYVAEAWRQWRDAHAQVEMVESPPPKLFPSAFRELLIIQAQRKQAITPPDLGSDAS